MNYFYLTTNILNREPEVIKAIDYVHIKAKVDGSQTLILTEQKIKDKDVAELTLSEAQALLDEWIDNENLFPVQDKDGNDILQIRINLKKYI